MKRKISGLISFIFPSFLAVFLLRLLGHKISYKSKIGFSILSCEHIELHSDAVIGSLNIISCEKLTLKKNSKIRNLNYVRGCFDIVLNAEARIGNSNKITRARLGIAIGYSKLELGHSTVISSSNILDLTKSITFGEYSQIAGNRTQLWTHGYYHYPTGPERFRIDGEIIIGNNVYIGTNSVINAGLRIGNAISVGSNSTVSKSILEPGLYVSQSLRYIKMDLENTKSKLRQCTDPNLVEYVYIKDVE